MHLLLPGRHHLLSSFQRDFLATVCQRAEPLSKPLQDTKGRPLDVDIDSVIWAVTSANHANTRRNPLPAHRREAAIERLSCDLEIDAHVYLVDDVGETPRFASYTLKAIEVASDRRLQLTPSNTVVGCSTPSVIHMYQALGFRVLPMELADINSERFHTQTPWQILNRLIELDATWAEDRALVDSVSAATLSIFHRYHYAKLIVDLHRSDLLTDDGNLTETRDYNVYVRAFDEGAKRKYAVARDYIAPGRIVDIGCCTGAVLREMSNDQRLHESDLFGIEVSRQLYTECQHRKQQGAFGNDHVFFYQKDFAAGPMFAPHSINTFTTFSLTHEIASYGGDEFTAGLENLRSFIQLLAEQLAVGGRWINVDVVGPEHGDETVLLWLNAEDGANEGYDQEPPADQADEDSRRWLADHLSQLSTLGRFKRFARDFRRSYGERIEFELQEIAGRWHAELRLEDACEFVSKKDYVDNWHSEMHERFCFWSYSDWTTVIEDCGLCCATGSKSYTNPWIVDNRYRGKVEFYRNSQAGLEKMDFPVTNMILVASLA